MRRTIVLIRRRAVIAGQHVERAHRDEPAPYGEHERALERLAVVDDARSSERPHASRWIDGVEAIALQVANEPGDGVPVYRCNPPPAEPRQKHKVEGAPVVRGCARPNPRGLRLEPRLRKISENDLRRSNSLTTGARSDLRSPTVTSFFQRSHRRPARPTRLILDAILVPGASVRHPEPVNAALYADVTLRLGTCCGMELIPPCPGPGRWRAAGPLRCLPRQHRRIDHTPQQRAPLRKPAPGQRLRASARGCKDAELARAQDCRRYRVRSLVTGGAVFWGDAVGVHPSVEVVAGEENTASGCLLAVGDLLAGDELSDSFRGDVEVAGRSFDRHPFRPGLLGDGRQARRGVRPASWALSVASAVVKSSV